MRHKLVATPRDKRYCTRLSERHHSARLHQLLSLTRVITNDISCSRMIECELRDHFGSLLTTEQAERCLRSLERFNERLRDPDYLNTFRYLYLQEWLREIQSVRERLFLHLGSYKPDYLLYPGAGEDIGFAFDKYNTIVLVDKSKRETSFLESISRYLLARNAQLTSIRRETAHNCFILEVLTESRQRKTITYFYGTDVYAFQCLNGAAELSYRNFYLFSPVSQVCNRNERSHKIARLIAQLPIGSILAGPDVPRGIELTGFITCSVQGNLHYLKAYNHTLQERECAVQSVEQVLDVLFDAADIPQKALYTPDKLSCIGKAMRRYVKEYSTFVDLYLTLRTMNHDELDYVRQQFS